MERKILILYYSLSGRTKIVEEAIKEKTNGDIEEILIKNLIQNYLLLQED